jgi:hypothetical protein
MKPEYYFIGVIIALQLGACGVYLGRREWADALSWIAIAVANAAWVWRRWA